MIIVEGPDGAGKTTLVEQLSTRLRLPVAPRVVSKETEAMVDLKVWVEQNVALGFQPKIFDRHRLISEFIYGPLKRREQEPGFNDLEWVQEMMFKFYATNPIIIYCLPDLTTVKANLLGDADNLAVNELTDQLYTSYLHRASLDLIHYNTNTHLFDYTQDSSDDLTGAVYEAIRVHKKTGAGNHGYR